MARSARPRKNLAPPNCSWYHESMISWISRRFAWRQRSSARAFRHRGKPPFLPPSGTPCRWALAAPSTGAPANGETARVSSKPSLASPPHSADASPSAKPCATGDRLHLSGECVKDAAFLGALDVPGVATHAPEASGPSEWPSSFWATLGALDDPSFVVPPELDYADDAARLSFD